MKSQQCQYTRRNITNSRLHLLECLISDQFRETKLLLWGELVKLVKDNDVVQFIKCNAKVHNENLVLMTTYSTGIWMWNLVNQLM